MPVGADVVAATTTVFPSGANAICELVDMISPITELFLNHLLAEERRHLQEAELHTIPSDFAMEQPLDVMLSSLKVQL
jgi:hypothetical protein